LQTYWDNKVLCPHLSTLALETLEKLSTLHKEVVEYEKHRNFKNKQREAFAGQKAALKQGECIILMDYKQNLRLGGGPREVGTVYYSKTQVSLLGCILYHKQNEIIKKTYNFFFPILSHDGLDTKRLYQDCNA